MSDLLIVLNPRKIPECVDAISALPIDKVWLTNYRLPEVQALWPELVDTYTGYDQWILISDDSIPRPFALAEVRRIVREGKHPVVTGYCNLSRHDMRVNLTRTPLLGDFPTVEGYDLYDFDEVQQYQSPVIDTWLAGFSLTAMPAQMWREFPFRCFTGADPKYGFAADFNLCKRLEHAAVPIVAARDAFVYHVKDVWNQMDADPLKRLYCEEEPSEIRFQGRSDE